MGNNAFDDFARGDVTYKGAPLAEMMGGNVSLANGSALVKTLRRGVAGAHKGSLEGTLTFQQAIIKTGMKEDFVDVVLKQKKVRATAIVADNIAIEVTGIMSGLTFTFSEGGFVTGDFHINGQIARV